MNYYEKYLKYKSKYLTLVNQVGGLHKIKLNDVKNIIFKINTILSSEEYMNFNTYENIVSIAENATLDEFIIYYLFNYNNKIFRVSNVDKLTHNLFDNISIIMDVCRKIYKKLAKYYVKDKINYLILPGDSPKYIYNLLKVGDSDFDSNSDITFKTIIFPASKMSAAYTIKNDNTLDNTYDKDFLKNFMMDLYKISREEIEDMHNHNIIVMDYSKSGSSEKFIMELIQEEFKSIQEEFKSIPKYINIAEWFFLKKRSVEEHIMDDIIYRERTSFRCQYLLPITDKNMTLFSIGEPFKYTTRDFTEKYRENPGLTFKEYFINESEYYNNCSNNCNLFILLFYLFRHNEKFEDKFNKWFNYFQRMDINGRHVELYNYSKGDGRNFDTKTQNIEDKPNVTKTTFDETKHSIFDVYSVE